MARKDDVVVVGAGLAGLACARVLQAAGREVRLVEAGDAPGGRVRTDLVDGFALDRGFQVLLTAYPAARRRLGFATLGLGEFRPGARVATPDGEGRLGDPWREPGRLWETLRAPVGSWADKLRVGRLRLDATRGDDARVWAKGAGRSAAEELAARGFSPAMTERFLRPWLGGIFLDADLRKTPAAQMFFVYRMFARGAAALPAGGMGRLAEQLAAGLAPGTLRLGAAAVRAAAGEVTLADGERLRAREVVVATEPDACACLIGRESAATRWRAVTTIYWAAPASPLGGEPVLWLNGTGRGRVNHLAVPSDVAGGYAPAGRALVSATVLGDAPEGDEVLAGLAQAELAEHFGGRVGDWRFLRVTRVRKALPVVARPGVAEAGRARAAEAGLWVCGDSTASASIEGALASGEAVAAGILAS